MTHNVAVKSASGAAKWENFVSVFILSDAENEQTGEFLKVMLNPKNQKNQILTILEIY